MVEKDFLEKLQQVCSSIEASRGDVNLFAILKMDELTDKWTVIVSAPWVGSDDYQNIFAEVRQLLIDNVGEAMNTIARIGIFNLDNHLSELMMQGYVSGDVIKSDEKINGNLVHEGYILKVVKPSS